jgi:hypothetical protein
VGSVQSFPGGFFRAALSAAAFSSACFRSVAAAARSAGGIARGSFFNFANGRLPAPVGASMFRRS